MQRILEHDGRSFFYETLTAPALLRLPPDAAEFPCLIWDTGAGWSPGARDALCHALIDRGCRYAVCGGTNCEDWHDRMDAAFLAQNLEGEEYDRRFVMTSWHTDEPPPEVAFFFVWATNFDQHDFRQYVTLQIGTDEALERDLTASIIAEATATVDDDDPADAESSADPAV